MRPFQSRQFILVFVASAVAVGSLLAPETALADTALFRVEQRWHNFPLARMTTPYSVGMYQGYIYPYYVDTPWGHYSHPPATAIVEPGNPIGGAFTLPTGFIQVSWVNSDWSRYFPGYTTTTYAYYYNGPGKFGPNNGATGPTRIVFPTTMGNPYPTYTSTHRKWINGNLGDGNPVTPTTTFDGRYDMSRGGSITVTPGPRRFGGTFRMFHNANAGWRQYVYYFYPPTLYEASGHYICLDEGKFGCNPSTFVSDIGDTTAGYQATWYLLTELGKTRATTPTTPNGKAPTPYGNASYLTGMRRYLNLIHPWTTGFAKVHNAKGSRWRTISPGAITAQAQGYDTSLGGVTLSVKKYNYNQIFDPTLSTLVTSTTTPYTQVLKGVTRVVSMVRPRLVHDYNVPLDPDSDPITNIWQVARMRQLKVFFLPEPAGMLLLGVGVAALLGLSRMRRR
jgi:hypothetical protein